MEREAGGEGGVGAGGAGGGADEAVGDREGGGGDVELGGGLGEQEEPRLGGGVEKRGAAVLHRVAAGGEALVGRAGGVRGDEADAGGGDVELLGDDLDERGFEALAELGLAGEGGDGAVRADVDPGDEERGGLEAAGELRGAGGGGGAGGWEGGRDEEAAAGGKQ